MKGDFSVCKTSGLLNSARFLESPNCDDRSDPQDISLVVIHNISLPPGQFGGEHIDQLFTNSLCAKDHPFFEEIDHLRVSSHVLIRRDGAVVQYVPFHKRAWHAGVSNYCGREVCNDFSIGIELEGTDDTAFELEQYESLIGLLESLFDCYKNLSSGEVTGHEHISPGRKTDPGPFFDWERLSAVFGTNLPADAARAEAAP